MQYIWFIWSLLLVVIWLAVYFSLDTAESKREMFRMSLWTSLLGLTEPLFVPEYWAPPSLFNLALAAGFDLESLIFSFGIGGIAVVLYERLFRARHRTLSAHEKHLPRHRYHLWAVFSGPITLVALLAMTDLNPIYSSVIALVAGGFAARYCRPDLKIKMLASAGIFLALYFFYFLTLFALDPTYVERVWNLSAISGILVLGIPLEELMFAASFGFYWSSVYEHLTWRKLVNAVRTS